MDRWTHADICGRMQCADAGTDQLRPRLSIRRRLFCHDLDSGTEFFLLTIRPFMEILYGEPLHINGPVAHTLDTASPNTQKLTCPYSMPKQTYRQSMCILAGLLFRLLGHLGPHLGQIR